MKYNILLACNAGLSTSMLVEKMRESSKRQGLDTEILAVSTNDIDDYVSQFNVVLLGPQVRFMKDQIQERIDIPVEVIDGMDYGMLQGDNVLKQGINLIEENTNE